MQANAAWFGEWYPYATVDNLYCMTDRQQNARANGSHRHSQVRRRSRQTSASAENQEGVRRTSLGKMSQPHESAADANSDTNEAFPWWVIVGVVLAGLLGVGAYLFSNNFFGVVGQEQSDPFANVQGQLHITALERQGLDVQNLAQLYTLSVVADAASAYEPFIGKDTKRMQLTSVGGGDGNAFVYAGAPYIANPNPTEDGSVSELYRWDTRSATRTPITGQPVTVGATSTYYKRHLDWMSERNTVAFTAQPPYPEDVQFRDIAAWDAYLAQYERGEADNNKGTTTVRRIADDAHAPHFTAPGYLVYMRDDGLYGQSLQRGSSSQTQLVATPQGPQTPTTTIWTGLDVNRGVQRVVMTDRTAYGEVELYSYVQNEQSVQFEQVLNRRDPRGGALLWPVLSPAGEYVAYIQMTGSRPNAQYAISIMHLASGDVRRISTLSDLGAAYGYISDWE